ncbi:hypothetical protein [Priestia megaterium]|uniref:hypothetical protein n=1 Tax=Priestia megaterium TaxID=1404 RepID=UPI000BFE1054|nr:hypothetical protein [Priestia megaterium]PGO60661.1 hypothetical protein CN981_08920 [Priestia megaterium]
MRLVNEVETKHYQISVYSYKIDGEERFNVVPQNKFTKQVNENNVKSLKTTDMVNDYIKEFN